MKIVFFSFLIFSSWIFSQTSEDQCFSFGKSNVTLISLISLLIRKIICNSIHSLDYFEINPSAVVSSTQKREFHISQIGVIMFMLIKPFATINRSPFPFKCCRDTGSFFISYHLSFFFEFRLRNPFRLK